MHDKYSICKYDKSCIFTFVVGKCSCSVQYVNIAWKGTQLIYNITRHLVDLDKYRVSESQQLNTVYPDIIETAINTVES